MQYTLPEIEPLVTWDDVENHPDYQSLDSDKQMNVKKGWFKKTIESSDEWESKDVFRQNLVRNNFFYPKSIPTPQKEALIKKYPEQWAAFMVGGGAARLPGAAIKGAKALPAFLKGAGETGLTLGMMDKGYEAGHEAVGMVTDNEYAKMIGGSVVAGALPVGAYYTLRYAVNRHSWPEAEPQPNVKFTNKWKAAYGREFKKLTRLLEIPWKKPGQRGGGPGGPKTSPPEPSWDDLMKKYGSTENLFKENGGMANSARKYKSVYEWMRDQRAKGDTSYQAEAEYRSRKAKAREDASKADSEFWENLKRQNKEAWDKANKAAEARRASGESKPQDKDFALTVVEDNLPISTVQEIALNARAGAPLISPEKPVTPPTIEAEKKGIPEAKGKAKEPWEMTDIVLGKEYIAKAKSGRGKDLRVKPIKIAEKATKNSYIVDKFDTEENKWRRHPVPIHKGDLFEVPEAKGKVKEPWEMSKEEYISANRDMEKPDIKKRETQWKALQSIIKKNKKLGRRESLITSKQWSSFTEKYGSPDPVTDDLFHFFNDPARAGKIVKPAALTQERQHYTSVQQAITEGKITSHPDYPELGEAKEPVITDTPKGKKVSVPMPEKKADDLSLKEQKKYLIDEIDKAIETADDSTDGTVTIEVPGDGTFTVLNNIKALTQFKKNARSYPTDATNKGVLKLTKPNMKPAGKRIAGEGIEYYNDFKPRKQNIIEKRTSERYQYYKDGFFGTAEYAVKLPNMPKTKNVTLTGKNAPEVKNVIETKGLEKAEIVGEFSEGAENPIVVAHIRTQGGKDILIQAKYADAILTVYPNAEVEVAEEKLSPVVFKDKNEIVGIVAKFDRTSVPEQFQDRMTEVIKEKAKEDIPDITLGFMGMQQLWDGIKDIFTETKPDAAPATSVIRPIADQIKLLFKKYYGLNPEMKKRFTAIEDGKEIIEHEVLDQIFNKGLPNLTKKEAAALTWHRSDPTKYPLPEGRAREAEFVNQTLEYAIAAQEKRGLSSRWPDTVISRIQSKIDTLEEEIKTMRNKASIGKRRILIKDLNDTLEALKKRRYVPHIAVPTFTKKILGMIESVVPGGFRPKSGEKLSSQVKRFLGRETLSLEEFVDACNKKKIEPELDIRVLLSDYLNYTMDKCTVYDEVERLKKIPDLILPVAEMPSDWKEIKGNKQLEGYGAHPFLAEAIKEFTSEYPARNILLKTYDSINRIGKFIVFYNPMIMTMNDMSQIFMGGALISKEMGKTMLGFAKPDMDSAVHDVMARSPLMKEAQKLGIFSTPWRGGPNMIELARMWADHLETTKPEWHKNLEKALGREVKPKDWLNPIISGKDFYDTAFKVTWALDRIWRMTQIRDFMRKGMSLPQAVERTRKLMVQYNYLPNKTRVNFNRVLLTPTYRFGEGRLYGSLFRHPAERIPLPYKGVSREQIPWEERTQEQPEGAGADYSQENLKTLGRYALLKFLMYVGAPLAGWQWLESYRMVKRKESGEEEVFTLPGPIFALEKYIGRALTNTLYLNLARIPYIIASLSKNRDWKGEKIIEKGAPAHVIGGQMAWYITKTYLAPLERFEMLSGDEQDAIGKVLSFLAVSKYTRQSPYSWQSYQIYKANREYIAYINPRNSAGIIDANKRPSPKNRERAAYKLRDRMSEIHEGFVKRQQKLREPQKENLFWQIFLKPQMEQ